MNSLFGIPIDLLTIGLAAVFAAIVGSIAVFALRSPILLKLGLRKIPRSWGRSALIVAGLMLATTIIAAALSTGDTMAFSFRNTARDSLGNIDETVSSARYEATAGQGTADTYFDEAMFNRVATALAGSNAVDGIAPAIIETVAVQDVTTRQNEPRVGLFAADPAHMQGFGAIRSADGATVTLDALGPGELYLNRDAAKELEAAAGDEVVVLGGPVPRTFRVAAVVEYEGTGTADEAILMPLEQAQELLGVPGLIKQVLISNKGGALSGAGHTESVTRLLDPVVAGSGLDVHPVKQDAVDLADEVAGSFTSFFTTFGMFSIVAGILLIFLLFVMLAAERRPEMGIARAVGTQRGQVVRMFLYEGLAYDVVAAAVGAFAGVAVAFAMVFVLAGALGSLGVDIEHHVRVQSLAVAYLLGVALTFVTVAISAWRVSSLNIVTAVRNLPDEVLGAGSKRRWWLGLFAIALGALICYGGVAAGQYGIFGIGFTIAIIGTVPILRRLGLPDRLAFTIPGIVIVVWFLLPADVTDMLLPEMGSDFSAFVVFGVAVILGATWVVMFNADLVVAGVMASLGRIRSLAPVLKTAVSRPLANRFRTGMAVAMFGLVVLTVVITSITTSAISNAMDDIETFGGGYDLRGTVLPGSSIDDFQAEATARDPAAGGAIASVGAQSIVSVEARQQDTPQEYEPFPLFGFDDRFLAAQPYTFATRAKGFETDAAVWDALRSRTDVAVVTSLVVPSRDNFGFGAGLPEFHLEGFYLEDQGFDPVTVDVRDPQTGAQTQLTIIGVLPIITPQEFLTGIVANQDAVAATFPGQAAPTAYWIALREGASVDQAATGLEAAFLDRGMEVDKLQDVLDEVVSANRTFTYLVQGFLGLGLIVGVAALAVISARSVVERRRDLAVLRSIGFQRWMVYLLVVTETSFIALIGIVLGFFLGLVISYSLISDLSDQPSWSSVHFAVPWLNLMGVFLGVYVAAVLTALLPARRAANVYPAAALRYE